VGSILEGFHIQMTKFSDEEDEELLGVQEALRGKYTVLSRVAGGGMADVYLATNQSVGGKWAIKVLSRDISREPKVVARFIAEARIGADIQHPNIVKVSDYGKSSRYYYLIMPFIEGEDLGERMKRSGPLAVSEAAAIAFQITKALECAHEHGVVHRDLKPSNIRIDRYGTVLVLDFGIARVRDDFALAKTIVGDRLGTPLFMSPEQAAGSSVDSRSDLYSLGVLLYEMISGTNPFNSKDSISTAVAHSTLIPARLTELRSEVHPQLSAVVEKLLQKVADKRFQKASEVRHELAPFAAGTEIRPAPAMKGNGLEKLLTPGAILHRRTPGTEQIRQLSENEDAILKQVDGARSIQAVVELSALSEIDATVAIESLQRDLIYSELPVGSNDVTLLSSPRRNVDANRTAIPRKDLNSSWREFLRPRKARVGAGAGALLVVILLIWRVVSAANSTPTIQVTTEFNAAPFADVVIRAANGEFVYKDTTPFPIQLRPGNYQVEFAFGDKKETRMVTIDSKVPQRIQVDFLDQSKFADILRDKIK
jgi:serine/threonine protein kinase